MWSAQRVLSLASKLKAPLWQHLFTSLAAGQILIQNTCKTNFADIAEISQKIRKTSQSPLNCLTCMQHMGASLQFWCQCFPPCLYAACLPSLHTQFALDTHFPLPSALSSSLPWLAFAQPCTVIVLPCHVLEPRPPALVSMPCQLPTHPCWAALPPLRRPCANTIMGSCQGSPCKSLVMAVPCPINQAKGLTAGVS